MTTPMDRPRPPRWMRRRLRSQTLTSTALAALFAATACGPTAGAGPKDAGPPSTTTSSTSTSTSSTSPSSPASTSSTSPRSAPTTTSTTSTTSTTVRYPYCETHPDGTQSCVIDGRPLRRKRRRGGLLLPEDDGCTGDEDARSEYASVASFSELALRLMAVGAPVELVEACHRAALEEIRHARTADAAAHRHRSRFGAVPGLLGRRIGGWSRSRRSQLRSLAVESFVDGWLNEGAAACRLRRRAAAAADPHERAALSAMADDEAGHARLAADIVTWCFEQDPARVGRALAALAA